MANSIRDSTLSPAVRSSAKADSIRERDRVVYRLLMNGTHKGEFLGVAPSGSEFDVVGMQQLGVIYTTVGSDVHVTV